MSTPVSGAKGPSSPPPGLENSNKVKDEGNKVKGDNNKIKEGGTNASVTAQARANFNSAVVQSSLNVAISAGNEPLALVLKSAITGINEELKAKFGDNAIQNAASLDNTPEGTSERIVSLSTAFYSAFRQQEGLEDNAASREQFIGVIRAGFEKGFEEAKEILDGLKVLKGDVASNIDKTFELVMKGYDAFLAAPGVAPAEPDEPAAP